jgi:3-oxoacyl-[acyl-carrier protein] reductase
LEAAKAGSHVALLGRNADLLKEGVSKIEALNRRAMPLQLNVANQGAVDDAVKKIHGEFQKIDFLVNNAGITRDNLLLTMKPEEWNDVIDTNLNGVMYCSKAVLKPMMKQRFPEMPDRRTILHQKPESWDLRKHWPRRWESETSASMQSLPG